MEGHVANIKETADILDVLVIGSGIAGLSAAVSACDAGARVAILERSTEESRASGNGWRASRSDGVG
jgi:tricarballylate dehydrogenase